VVASGAELDGVEQAPKIKAELTQIRIAAS